ncbi:hypothetical protein [Salicola sp. Rm-C-2C1-2]|uniref:hypothetical protein n=1 Tax=Salicola sp. Rm-C-2C1-2 TaxID=3141321 RepID=UPI0032E3B21D
MISISRVKDGLFETSLGDIDRPVTFTLEAISADGDFVRTSKIEVINTSAVAVIREAELITHQTETVIALPEDRRFFAYVLDLLYLRGDITESEKTRLLTDYDDRSESWQQSLRNRADHVESTLAEYRNGETGDRKLESATDRFEAEMRTAGDINLHNVEKIPDSASDFMPDLKMTRIHYSDQARGYTRFYGNSHFGQHDNGSFSFSDAYVWLREIAQGSGDIMCNTETAVSS